MTVRLSHTWTKKDYSSLKKYNTLKAERLTHGALFKNISYCFSSGKIYTIFGKSGIGKSTFLKALSRNILYQGEIFFNEQNVKDISPQQHKVKINYLPQESAIVEETLIKDITSLKQLSVNKNILIDESKVLNLGNMLELSKDLFYKNVALLSGGEKQRGAIIRSLMLKPSFLLMDEPTSALDIYSQRLVIELIKKVTSVIGFIIVSHSPEVIESGDIKLFMDKNGFEEIDKQISPDEISQMIKGS